MTEERNAMPLIGDKAPEFKAMTTKGKINFPEDYKGSWVIMFSHPADFTPVCTTEFMAFETMAEEFAKINTRLLGLSIDSLHSHLAWVKNIEKIKWNDMENTVISFPIIADIRMEIAKKYGMLHTVANTQTVRAVFVIDPEGVIRAILYYPMCTGRNIQEIKRMIQSLQLHDAEQVATPANWVPGEDVLLGAPLTLEEAESRVREDSSLEEIEWYLTARHVTDSSK